MIDVPLYNDGPEVLDEVDTESMDYYINEAINECNLIDYQMNHHSGFFMEASNKPGLLRRLFNFIIGLFSKLKDGVLRIISKIREFIHGKKVSIKQIIDRCGIKPRTKHTSESLGLKEETVHFYATEGSDLKETDLKILVNHLSVKILNDKFIVNAPGIEPGANMNGPHRSGNWQINYYAAAAIIEKLELNEMLFKISDMLVYNESKGGLIDIEEGFIDKVNEFHDAVYNVNLLNELYNKGGIQWNTRDLMTFQQRLTKETAKLNKIQTIEGIQDDLLKSINKFADMLLGIAIGLNEFNRAINNVYMIDESYVKSVNNASTLDMFVFSCIKEGIPYKYIAYNTWLLLNDKWLMNEKTFFTKNVKPKWGQTRTVFDLKDRDVVMKIAMSNIGITGNRNEVLITKEFKKYNVENLIACVKYVMKNFCIIFPQAIVSYKTPDDGDLYDYQDKLDDLYWDHPNLHDIRSDIHIKNIGFNTDGDVVCIDYGTINITKKVK